MTVGRELDRIAHATPKVTYEGGCPPTVALTNGSGRVVNSYSYAPYGNATSTSEQASNPFRYVGSVFDSNTGLYKMGATITKTEYAERIWSSQ